MWLELKAALVSFCLTPILFPSLLFYQEFNHQKLWREVRASQQIHWNPLFPTPSIHPSSLSLLLSVQASLCFWQLLLTIMNIIANFCENWHIWQLKCHMPYRIFFGRFPHFYNRWIWYERGSLLIHSFPFFSFTHLPFMSFVCFRPRHNFRSFWYVFSQPGQIH